MLNQIIGDHESTQRSVGTYSYARVLTAPYGHILKFIFYVKAVAKLSLMVLRQTSKPVDSRQNAFQCFCEPSPMNT